MKLHWVRELNDKDSSISLFLGIFSFFLLVSVNSICQNNEDVSKINISALSKVSILLEKIPVGMETEYGFKNREDFNKIELLNPINIILPSPLFLSSESIDTANVNFYSSKYWKIPVSIDGKICCFLQGMFIGDNFKVFGIGGNLIAHRLNSILEKPLINSNMQRSILMFPDLKKQYIVYYNNEITYLESKCILLDDFYDPTLINEYSILEILNQAKNYYERKKLQLDES